MSRSQLAFAANAGFIILIGSAALGWMIASRVRHAFRAWRQHSRRIAEVKATEAARSAERAARGDEPV